MSIAVWTGFVLLVLVFLALDLGVFHRTARAIGIAEALAWTAVWVVLALAFNAIVYAMYGENWFNWSELHQHEVTGREAVVQFFTGYLLEKSLSVDNIFVIAMIFAYFNVPLNQQHRVLFWGILGAIVLRGIMIGVGAALIARFAWVTYVLGAVLLVSAIKLLVVRHDNIQPERNLLLRLARRLFPVTSQFEEGRFVRMTDGRWAVTPLLLTLLLVESTDVLFAVDSIPAIFAVTTDPFIVFTSNVFAILGLRSLYFALAGLMHRFRYLKMSLVFVLAYVGVKMLLTHHYPIPNLVSLAVIVAILGVGVIASVIAANQDTARLISPLADDLEVLVATTYRQARRIVILIVGTTVLMAGIAMIALPGPAVVVVPLGLAILSVEFAWARVWLRRVRAQARHLQHRVEHMVRGDDATEDDG